MALSDWQPSASLTNLQLRAALNRTVRDFFAEREVLEVETPIFSDAGNTEPNIESFVTEFHGRSNSPSPRRWLRTSPEFAMKRLLAAEYGDCYELGRVFRDGEAGGRHNPEFTMLEWYRMGWTMDNLIAECISLIERISQLRNNFMPTVHRVTFRELYLQWFGFDPLYADVETLRAPLKDIDIPATDLSRDDWLDLLMTHLVQPEMREGEAWIVSDFPATQAALARIDGDVAKRFEIYWNGYEVANGYDELVDAEEQRQRFRQDIERRANRGQPEVAMDERLVAALGSLRPCSGVAMGVDRLMMILAETNRISEVIAFDFERS